MEKITPDLSAIAEKGKEANELGKNVIAHFDPKQVTQDPQAPPAVPTQTYSFTFDSFQVVTARSGSLGGYDKGNDTDYAGFCVQVNNGTPLKLTKFINQNCSGSNTYAVDMAFNSVKLADTDAVAIISTIVNSSQSPQDTTAYLDAALTKVAGAAASALGKLLGKELTDAVKAEAGAAIGAALGTEAIPVIGSALGALAGLLVGSVEGLLAPNCDGPVGGSLFLYSGAQLRAAVTNGHPIVTTVNYPGVDSSDGCGDNSNYNATYSIVLVPAPVITPVNIHDMVTGITEKAEIKQ